LTRRRAAAWLFALAVVFFAVHAQRLGLPYFWDDFKLIRDNAALHANPASAWVRPMTPNQAKGAPNYYRPLPFFLLGVAGDAAGFAEPRALNALHLALSLLAVLAFFALAARLMPAPTAFTLAAVFAVFPTNVEVFAWLSCLPDVLVFVFLALFAYALERDPGRARPAPLAMVALAGALASKEGGVAALFVALAWDWPQLRAGAWGRLLRFHGPLWALAGAFALVRAPIVNFTPPLVLSPALHLRTVGAYAAKLVSPWPLAVLVGDRIAVWDWQAVLGGAVVAALAAAILLTRDRAVRLGAALAAGGLVPYANFWIPSGELYLIAERYMLVPLAGALLIAGGLLGRLRRPAPARAVLGALGLLYAVTSWQQYAVWRDPRAQWTNVIETNPTKISPYYRRAYLEYEAGELEAAQADSQKAFEMLGYWAARGVTNAASTWQDAHQMATLVALAAGDYAAAVSHARADFRLVRSPETLKTGLLALDHTLDLAALLQAAQRANAAYPADPTFAVLAINLAVTAGEPALAWEVVKRSAGRYAEHARAITRDAAAAATLPAAQRGLWMYQATRLVSPAFAQFARGATDMTAAERAGVAELAYGERLWRESERYYALALMREARPAWAVRRGFALAKLGRHAEACRAWLAVERIDDPELEAILESLHAGCRAK
jgi:hypothetical protein